MGYTITNASISKLEFVNDGSFNKFQDLTATTAHISASNLGGGGVSNPPPVSDTMTLLTTYNNVNPGLEGISSRRYETYWSSSLETRNNVMAQNGTTQLLNFEYIPGEDISVTVTRTVPDNTTNGTLTVYLSQQGSTESTTIDPPSGKSNNYSVSAPTTVDGGTSWTWTFRDFDDSVHGSPRITITEQAGS